MKKIRGKKDLAINGAEPFFKDNIHVGRPNLGEKQTFLNYAEDIFDTRWLSNNGPYVKKLEKEIKEYLGVNHCVCMCNGTVALEIAIRSLELTGEVIIPSFTFIATAHALSWQNITPVFADIDETTHLLSPDSIRSMITPRTTGVVVVNLWGRTFCLDEYQLLADEYNLKLMFDSAHAFGCSWQGQLIGNFGECEVFSFHATKFFNSIEGGAVVTNNSELADKLMLMRNFGFSGEDNVIHHGTNGKMNEMAAAMGLVNLQSIDRVVEANKSRYLLYKAELSALECIKILEFDENQLNNYQYVVIELRDDSPVGREELIEILHAENIRARKYFWPGCHNMKPYKELYPHAGLLLPNTCKVAERVMVLPTGITLSDQDIKNVCRVIKCVLEG